MHDSNHAERICVLKLPTMSDLNHNKGSGRFIQIMPIFSYKNRVGK